MTAKQERNKSNDKEPKGSLGLESYEQEMSR